MDSRYLLWTSYERGRWVISASNDYKVGQE